MNTMTKITGLLLMLLALQAHCHMLAQENRHQLTHTLDLPPELNPDRTPVCSLEFQEEWVIDPAGASISKTVDSFSFPCSDSTITPNLPEGPIRIKNMSFEFSFLDLPEQRAKEIQKEFIALIHKRSSIPRAYDPEDQLLSIHFHENWSLDASHKVFTKKVLGITPVIWQRRQTAEGEAIPDGETGLPVFYKLELPRIDLRQP